MIDEAPFVLFANKRWQKDYYVYIKKELKGSDTFEDVSYEVYDTISHVVHYHYGTLCSLMMPTYMLQQSGYLDKKGKVVTATPYGVCPISALNSPCSITPERVIVKVRISQVEFMMLKKYLTADCNPSIMKDVLADTSYKNMDVKMDLFNSVPNLTRYYRLLLH